MKTKIEKLPNNVEIRRHYDENGDITSEYSFKNDKRHNENGPAIVLYGKNGNKGTEFYYKNNKLHREDGLAVAMYDENGNIKAGYFYINDEELTKEEFELYKKEKELKEHIKGLLE